MRFNLSRKKLCQLLVVASYPAILVLIWDYMMTLELSLNQLFFEAVEERRSKLYIHYSSYASSVLACFLYPIFGLLADVWTGRYKAILIGMVFCFLSWIIEGIGFIIDNYHHNSVVLLAFYGIAYFFQYCGYTCFTANIIQFNIDQLIGASADELSTLIYWHTAVTPAIYIFIYILLNLLKHSFYVNMTIFITSGLAVSVVLVSHSLFKYKLEKVSLIKNPIKLIIRVLCYARKHKYPENRSALTYWEEEAPSRMDLGKKKYGGPFTEEEVENVKTFFGILPFFMAILGFVLSDCWFTLNIDTNNLVLLSGLQFSICSLIILFVYLFFIRIFFYKFTVSMLFRMSLGLFLALIVGISEMIVAKLIQLDVTFFNTNKTIYIYLLFLGISKLLVTQTSLEFIVAQTPVQMRGMMVGFWLASWNVGFIINSLIKFSFNCESKMICTSFFYYLTKNIIIFVILILFVILARRYKYRVRENEVNIVQIVDDHYQKYMEQEEQFKRQDNDHFLIRSTSTSYY